MSEGHRMLVAPTTPYVSPAPAPPLLAKRLMGGLFGMQPASPLVAASMVSGKNDQH